jgi:hypothetical protein
MQRVQQSMLGTNIVEHIVATALGALSEGRPKDLWHIIEKFT